MKSRMPIPSSGRLTSTGDSAVTDVPQVGQEQVFMVPAKRLRKSA